MPVRHFKRIFSLGARRFRHNAGRQPTLRHVINILAPITDARDASPTEVFLTTSPPPYRRDTLLMLDLMPRAPLPASRASPAAISRKIFMVLGFSPFFRHAGPGRSRLFQPDFQRFIRFRRLPPSASSLEAFLQPFQPEQCGVAFRFLPRFRILTSPARLSPPPPAPAAMHDRQPGFSAPRTGINSSL